MDRHPSGNTAMTRALAIALMALAAWGTPSFAAPPTGYDLYSECTCVNNLDTASCLGYLRGALDGAMFYAALSQPPCPAGVIKAVQLLLIFLRWARESPHVLCLNSLLVAMTSFAVSSPCSRDT